MEVLITGKNNPWLRDLNKNLTRPQTSKFKLKDQNKEEFYNRNLLLLCGRHSRMTKARPLKIRCLQNFKYNIDLHNEPKDLEIASFLNSSDKTRTRKSQAVHLHYSRANEIGQAEIEKTFIKLANQWLSETRGLSSTNEMSMHPAYQQIIGMGSAVVPLLLRELEKNSGRWFWALKSITREDPVPSQSNGKTRKMIRAWLDWGKERNYRW